MRRRKTSDQQPVTPREQAVALRYHPEKQDAPVLVAKGKGLVARHIIDKAMEHDIPIQEDASLVEVLSKLELNQQIPPELYQLVAEVLSFVYRADQRVKEWSDLDER